MWISSPTPPMPEWEADAIRLAGRYGPETARLEALASALRSVGDSPVLSFPLREKLAEAAAAGILRILQPEA